MSQPLRKTAAVVVFATLFAVAGCGGSDESASNSIESAERSETVMPDVLGRTLDVALSDVERAGFEDEVEVQGGGTFGVVVESNWQVCEQLPAAGQPVTDTPLLTVDRSCDGDATESTTPPTSTEPATSDQPSEDPVQEPDEPEALPILTVENSEDLAALLAGPGCGEDTIAAFADQYRDRTIEFDGHVSNFQNHGDYDTRYDILLNTGDFSETTEAGIQNGPNFKFEDVNFFDLNFTGPDDSVTTGDDVTVVASVEEWNPDNCLFFLDPVSTRAR
ncbi:MAG: DUF4839 domain-containing protein [Ilumatobacter sp.]|jgi:hypothetical protein|uniref:DUF4839 domain-containing protein n=1 Tax=Ilumatobacter sp. TaxID=1967498 RepID=UPI003752DAA8|nr:DUF4839 domain-containing protein [Ilumatobacter sp.]